MIEKNVDNTSSKPTKPKDSLKWEYCTKHCREYILLCIPCFIEADYRDHQ